MSYHDSNIKSTTRPKASPIYYNSEVEILSVSQEHEIFSRMIVSLSIDYFVEKDIEFNPLASFTQEKGENVSAQADESLN